MPVALWSCSLHLRLYLNLNPSLDLNLDLDLTYLATTAFLTDRNPGVSRR